MANSKFLNIYTEFLKKFIKVQKELKVVFDCSNGSSGMVLKLLFAKHKYIKAIFINDNFDGNFSAHGPNPLADGATDQLIAEVIKQKADLGVILDNDGDRAFFVDETGRQLTATESLIFLSKNFSGPVAVDFMIGPLAYEELKKEKRKVIASRVGTYFIKKTMRENKIGFGGEYSGHFYFEEFFGSDSGILAAIFFMNQLSNIQYLKSNISTLGQWLNILPRYYQTMVNFKFEREKFPKLAESLKKRFGKQAQKVSDLDGIKFEFDKYWFNFRLSNTEDLLRLTVETQSKADLDSLLPKLKHLTE